MPSCLPWAADKASWAVKLSALVTGLGLMLAAPARAGLDFVLTSATQSGLGSNEVVFAAALTNTSLIDNTYLNDIRLSFTGAATNYLTADTNIFFANVPGILPTGGTYRGVVFGVAINRTTPPGDYSGTVILAGGSNIFATNQLAGQTFQISLPPAALTFAFAQTNLVLSWPSPPGRFVLEQNADLAATNWAAATNVLTVSNGWNEVTISPITGDQFYRLAYP